MGAPKSVIKLKKQDGRAKVEYESSVDASMYYLHELTRSALRDVGRFLKKDFNERFYSYFERHTGKARSGTSYKIWSSKSTKYPRLEIGTKGGKGSYAYEQEFGTSSTPRLGLLQQSAQENIEEIVKIQSQYLSGLNDKKPKVPIGEGEINEE